MCGVLLWLNAMKAIYCCSSFQISVFSGGRYVCNRTVIGPFLNVLPAHLQLSIPCMRIWLLLERGTLFVLIKFSSSLGEKMKSFLRWHVCSGPPRYKAELPSSVISFPPRGRRPPSHRTCTHARCKRTTIPQLNFSCKQTDGSVSPSKEFPSLAQEPFPLDGKMSGERSQAGEGAGF